MSMKGGSTAMSRSVPENVEKAMTKLVESFYAGKKASSALKAIQKWLLDDGWDDLVTKGSEESVINLTGLAQGRLIDSECRCNLSVPDKEKIRDSDRIRHARIEIAEAVKEYEGIFSPTAISYPVIDSVGREVVVGALIEVHGQLGPEVIWWGVHASTKSFFDELRAHHLYRSEEADSIPERAILLLWDYDEARGA